MSKTSQYQGGMSRLRLSPMQKNIWLNEQISTDKSIYNLPIGIALEGELDVERLKQSIRALVQRHFSLSLKFTQEKGDIYQSLEKCSETSLNYEDLTTLSSRKRRVALFAKIEEMRKVPFDLQSGQLVKFSLFRFKKRNSVLVIIIHHLVSDAWSQDVLLRDLNEFYSNGSFAADAPRITDYEHYINRLLDSKPSPKTNEYLERFSNVDSIKLKPDFYARGKSDSPIARKAFYTVDKEVVRLLKQEAVRRKCSMFSLTLCVSAFTLSHFSNTKEFLLPITKGHRNLAEMENAVVCMTEQVLIPFRVDSNTSFSSCLEETNGLLIRSLQDDYPTLEAVKVYVKEGHGQHIENTINFLYQNSSTVRSVVRENLTLSPISLGTTPALYDLTISIAEEGEELSLSLEYRDDLYSSQTIESISSAIRYSLLTLTKGFERKVSELLPLDEGNQSILHGDVNDELPRSVYSLFEDQCLKTPDAKALQYNDEFLNYKELEVLANEIFDLIISRKYIANCRIGLYGFRDFTFIAAVLAIFKANYSYTPLCSSLPIDVVRTRITSAGIGLILCAQEKLPGTDCDELDIVCLTDIKTTNNKISSSHQSETQPHKPAHNDGESSTIFTSGSTGSSQGVKGSNIGLLNRIAWQQKHYPISGESRVIQKTSINFVDSIAEIVIPLTMGACSYIYDDSELRELDRLAEFIAQRKITHITLVPSLLKSLLTNSILRGKLSSLENVVCSGETLTRQLTSLIEQYLGNATVLNIYGSTEVSADVTCHVVTNTPWLNSQIGKPMLNTTIYVLDEAMKPVTLGAVGEIYVSGYCMSNGYLDGDGNTSRFITNPFSPTGELLFRTRDIGRINNVGVLEYIGRNDDVVKIRGNRISLQEIECVVDEYSGIVESIAIVSNTLDDTVECILVLQNRRQFSRDDFHSY